MLIANGNTITTTSTNYSRSDSKSLTLFRYLTMSTIICTISLKLLMAMIFILMIASWYTAKKYYEHLGKQQQQRSTFAIAAGTTITFFSGQFTWAKVNKLRLQRNWENSLKQLPKTRIKSAPGERAAVVMSR